MGNKKGFGQVFPAIVISFIMIMAAPAASFADAAVVMMPTGPGTFSIEGLRFDKVAAIDIIISYDQEGFSNPRVTRGLLLKGAVLAVNASEAGIIRLAAVIMPAITGNGSLASVVFKPEEIAVHITSIAARLFTMDGKAIPVLVRI